ncbi:MAG: 4-(cytidine 5'-diphospho)-2-C-methyl-D-erythritol kinase [Candidatus Omnitrophota bacterium]
MASPLIISQKSLKNLCGSVINLRSPAKINLYLNILGRYRNGYHRIESIIERVSLCDELKIEVSKSPQININSNIKSLGNSSNLCYKAAILFKKKFSIKSGVNIYLKKRIPVGAGLGGGSSNAASTLIGMSELFSIRPPVRELFKIGSTLGSDVNFFLAEASFAYVYGRGDKILPFEAKALKHYIAWPGVFLSTARVYKNYRAKLTMIYSNAKMLIYALKRGDAEIVEKIAFNSLENKALSLCKELRKVKEYCSKIGILSRVTGSGSALYSLNAGKLTDKDKRALQGKGLVFSVRTF